MSNLKFLFNKKKETITILMNRYNINQTNRALIKIAYILNSSILSKILKLQFIKYNFQYFERSYA